MPLLKINAQGPTPLPDGPAASLESMLRRHLAAAATGPVVVLLHGYQYAPHHPTETPHRHVLSLAPDARGARSISWPRHLGFGRAPQERPEGLCIAFGWPARGTLWQAHRRAADAGQALAAMVRMIHRIAPHRQVDVLAHSLGARVFLSALAGMPAAAMGRAILMAAAELRSTAGAAIACPVGRAAEVFNITSRENDPYDFLFERLIAPLSGGARSLGHGLAAPRHNWLDIQIDGEATLEALQGLGFRISPPHRRVCHWSAYLRPGLFPFYRSLLRDRDRLTLPLLRATLPEANSRRWSRLLARPARPWPLPFRRKA